MFTKSKEALFELQQILQCRQCDKKSSDLLCLGSCQHWFCRSCAECKSGHPCPLCGVPSVASNTCVDRQLTNIVALCSQIQDLINGSDNNVDNIPSLEESKDRELQQVKLKRKKGPKLEKESEEWMPGSSKKVQYKVRKKEINWSESFSNGVVASNEQSTESKGLSSTPVGAGLKGENSSSKKRKVEALRFNANQDMEEKMQKINGRSVKKSMETMEKTPNSKYTRRRSQISEQTPIGGKHTTVTPKESNHKGKKIYNEENITPKSKRVPGMISLSSKKIDTPSSGKKKGGGEGHQTNLNKRNAKGETPLQVATIKINIAEVKRLLDAGANPNVKDNAGWTPLHEAVCQGSTDIASILLSYGASVSAPGLNNETPLHDAVIYQYIECVHLLVDNGADVNARNIYGNSPLDIAQNEEIKDIMMKASDSSTATSDMPMLDESSKPLCLTGSNLSKEERKLLIQYSRNLNGRVVEDITPEVTHVVTTPDPNGSCTRTLKYLNGIVTGKWIVTLQWLSACCDKKERIPEAEFQVAGCHSFPFSMAPKRSSENRLKQLPPLFAGCQVYFYGKFTFHGIHKDQLSGLVKQGGGAVLKREPHLHNLDDYPYTRPYHAQNSPFSDCTIYVIYDDACPNPPSVNAQRMTCLPASWLLDSIASFTFLEKDYKQEK